MKPRKPLSLDTHVLIVDDQKSNLKLLRLSLESAGFMVSEASNGIEALELLKGATACPIDVVLTDLMMPGMDGIELVRAIKGSAELAVIPVVVITASLEKDSRMRALQEGAEDFLTRPIERFEVVARIKNLSRLKAYQNLLKRYNEELKKEVEAKTAELQQSHLETLLMLAKASEYRDEETGQHIQRMGEYAQLLALKMGLDKEFAANLLHAAPMHDVGKIGIPDSILLKPGPLSDGEWGVMKSHTVLGGHLLKSGRSPYLKVGARIALGHHERFDGSGYPAGLKAEAIPLEARIVQVCDTYDALRSKRPYKPPFEHRETLEIISRGDGRTRPEHFDPEVLSAFQKSAKDFEEIFESFRDGLDA